MRTTLFSKLFAFFFKVWKGYRGKLEEILPRMLFKADRENGKNIEEIIRP